MIIDLLVATMGMLVLALLYKNEFHDWISVEKASPNFVWFKISNSCYTKTTKAIFVWMGDWEGAMADRRVLRAL